MELKKQTKKANINAAENVKVYKHIHTTPEKVHTHEFIEIAYIYSGSGTHTINGRDFFVKRGDLIFMGLGDSHSFTPRGEMGVNNCLIAPEFLSSITPLFDPLDILSLANYRDFSIDSFTPCIQFSKSKYYDVERLFDMMTEEFSEKKPGYITAIAGYLQTLLVRIFRQITLSENMNLSAAVEKIAPEVLKFIEENYHRKISLSELAEESFYSPAYFSKIFKECFGKSLTAYVNELRINEAVKLLSETDLSVEEIAHKVGYEDKKQFYKVFKETYGKTPGDYRK